MDQNISDDDDVIYIATDGNEDDKINELKHIKKEPAVTTSSLSSSDNDFLDTDVTIPPFKHKRLIRKGGNFVCSQCKMDFGTKSELHNHFASHTNITFKCNICSYSAIIPEHSYKNHCYYTFQGSSYMSRVQ